MKMSTKTRLLLSAVTAASIAATAAPTYAQDSGEEESDEIVVVGSRIARTIDDSALPVTVIDSLDIELSGISSLSDLVRSTSYNTFGSFRERSGTSFTGVATINFKGLGANRSAVLLNGRRMPGSAITGGSIVDLNTLPLSAIESVTVLKDSASAIYGADAIGGVLDIRLKDDFEGLEVGFNAERPSLPGADSMSFNATWGKTFDKGNLIIGYEHFERDPISDGSREYSRADTTGPEFDTNTVGVSVGGNTGFETDFSNAFPLGDCGTDVYAGVFTNPFGISGSGCGFAYADISLQTGRLNRESVFLNGAYEISDNAELYVDGSFTNSDTGGRYAPAVGFFGFSSESPFNTLGRDILAFHRFVGHGNRDDTVDTDQYFVSAGLRGDLTEKVGFDVYGRYFNYKGVETGNTYVLANELEAEVAAGNYDVFNPLSQDATHLGAIERTSAVLTRDLLSEDIMFGATLDGSFKWDLAGGDIGWAAGVEFGEQNYTDVYDEFREALNVLGSAGNSASGDRTRGAAFGEVRLPFADNFEVNLAGRYDEFDDIGGEFSPQASARWTVTDNLKIRGSWGKGFKAPDLIELNQELAESFNDLQDQFRCDAIGLSPCPSFQVQNFSGGNSQLKAETSESFSAGLIANIGDLALSADFYTVKIEDAVTSPSLARINALEADGDLPPGVVVNRAPTTDGTPGAVISIVRPLVNAALFESNGLDFSANYGFETPIGDIDLNGTWVHVLDYNTQANEDSDVAELVGFEGTPENRANSSVRWSKDGFNLTWNTTYIDSHEDAGGEDTREKYDDYWTHDIRAGYNDAFGMEGLTISGGVLNVTEVDPPIDPILGYDDGITLPLYEVRGRVPYINVKYHFQDLNDIF